MKKAMLAALLGIVLSACGGEDGGVKWRDPDSFDPQFGEPSSSLTSDEQAAWQGGAAALNEAPALVDQTDDAAADAGGMNLTNLPNQLQTAFGDSYGTAVRAEERAVKAQALALLTGAPIIAAATWDNFATCWTLTGTELRYDRCRRTETQDGTTITTTLDGWITRHPGLVTWDVTIGVSASTSGMDVTATDRLRGEVAFSTVDPSFAGRSRSEIYERVSYMGRSVEAAVTFSADYDLDYATDPGFCVTGGTLTAKRIWSLRPAGADPARDPELRDAAVQFTWLGCNSVQVAWSVD
jgi:hypothetical protein